MSLTVVRHATARDFLARAERWLLSAEDRHNLILSLTYGLGGQGAGTYFATVERDGRVVGAAFRAPPHQVLLTAMPEEAVEPLAHSLLEPHADLPAVLGPPELAAAFARVWSDLVGVQGRVGTDQRLYRLNEVSILTAAGGLRVAQRADLDLAVAWAAAFARDVHQRFGPGEEAIGAWIDRGHVFFWEDERGPVSLAVAHGRTPRGVRVGYVYTPPELRRRGYAGALVSTLSQRLLAEGKDFCVLYADLSNSTTNALYQRMGYRPLMDVRDYSFDPETTG